MKALNKQVSKMPEAELIRAIAEASELRPRDGRDVVALRIYEQVLKPLLDEQSELEERVANESDCADSTINLAINWQMRCKDAEAKLETAESKCRELAAELSAVDKIHNEAVFITDDHYEQCPSKVQKMIRSLAVLQIPAYDAFMAEVRAQGVDLVCDYHKSRCEALFDVDRKGSQRHGAALCDAIDIAAQLRKGAAL